MTTIDRRLDNLFAELREAPDGPPPRRNIAIISTPRSGSKHFCESLASSGRCGRPLEWMNGVYLTAYTRVLGINDIQLDQYVRFIAAKTTSRNGVFAINFHVDTYASWRDRKVDLLALGFDKVYYVFRRDKLAQALSLAKALRSGRWRASDTGDRDISAAEMPDSEILNALYNLSLYEEYYRTHLKPHVQREFCYEDYLATDTAYREVLGDLGVEHRDLKEFGSTLTIQRTGGDAQRIRDLMVSLGQPPA